MLKVPNTLQLLSRSASKCLISVSQTTDQIITHFLDGVPTIRALTSLDISNNGLGGYYESHGVYDEWISDMTGIKALAAAIPECK